MGMRFRFGWGLSLFLAGGMLVSTGYGQSISGTSPQGLPPGKATDVKIRGAGLAGTAQLWTSFRAESVLTPDLAGNGTNAAEVSYRVTVPADVAPGIYGIRLATPGGVTNLRLIAIDDLPSVAQVKPNQTLAAAQTVTLPVAIDGAVDNLGRDFYKFQVAAGQRVAFEVIARRLGSPLDSIIRLLDSQGRELAYSEDVPGLGPDSQLAYTFKDAGEYVLELRDIRWQGSAAHQYRLRMGDFPCVNVPYPLGVAKGAPANVTFAGSGVEGLVPISVQSPADQPAEWLNVAAKMPGGQSSAFGVVSVGTGPEALEVEPNNEAAQATRIDLGACINGRFDTPGDIDRFVFTAKAGQHFVFKGVTRQQGSPVDLELQLLKPDGSLLVAAEDAGPDEGSIDFTAPADGDYSLVARDLHRRGGPEFAYRLDVRPFEQKFSLSATADTLNIPAGGVTAITVNAIRGPFTGPITLSLVDAPEGLTATPTVIGPGLATTVLTVHCAPNVPANQVLNVRIQGTTRLGDVTATAIAGLTDAQKTALSGLQTPPPALAQTVAMGVSPAPLFTLQAQPPTLVFGKSLTATVKIVATRAEGFGEEIQLALLPPQNGLPAGVTAAVAPIPKGANEVSIVFTATDKVPMGQFSGVLQGTGKMGNTTSVQPVPAIGLELKDPFTLKIEPAATSLARGQQAKLKVIAERNPAYPGPIVLTLENLPKGVTAAAATIAEGQTEVEVVLTAAADAAQGEVKNVTVKGEGAVGAAKLPGTSAPASLTVP